MLLWLIFSNSDYWLCLWGFCKNKGNQDVGLAGTSQHSLAGEGSCPPPPILCQDTAVHHCPRDRHSQAGAVLLMCLGTKSGKQQLGMETDYLEMSGHHQNNPYCLCLSAQGCCAVAYLLLPRLEVCSSSAQSTFPSPFLKYLSWIQRCPKSWTTRYKKVQSNNTKLFKQPTLE